MSVLPSAPPPHLAARAPTVRVLVVDDSAAFRTAAVAVVRRTRGFAVAGEAVDGEQALRRAAALQPELVLLDINLPDIDGIAVCEQLVRRPPPPYVVLCSTYSAEQLPSRAATCGALAYLPKDELRPSVLLALWEGRGAVTRPTAPRQR